MATILVCDDDKDIVEAISIYLEQEGHQILKAYDGQQALLVLQKNEVDLLIIDVMMPKLDGIRATLKIREEHSLPIIILSAKSEDADKILGLNVGADDYVTKPFSPLELIARVRSQLRRYTQLGAAVSCESQHIYTTGGLSAPEWGEWHQGRSHASGDRFRQAPSTHSEEGQRMHQADQRSYL